MALDAIGLLGAVLGLGESAFLQWLAARHGMSAPRADRMDLDLALMDDVDEEGGVADSHNPDESANPKAEESSREKENSQNRRVAFRFVSSGGLLLVPILRLVVDPLAKLLREHLYLASAR